MYGARSPDEIKIGKENIIGAYAQKGKAMKDYKNFTETMERLAKEKYGNNSVKLETVRKTNDLEYVALVIMSDDTNIFPTIYLESYYDEYCEGKMEEDVFLDIVSAYERHKLDKRMDIETFKNYKKIKDKIIFRLINTEKNAETLKDIPHREFLNLSIVYYLLLEAKEDMSASAKITLSHIESWGVTEQELYDRALINTPKLLAPNIMSLPEMLAGMMGEDVLPDYSENPMRVLTNSSRSHGASCILYPDYLKSVAANLNSDLVILPSSLHEIMILRADDETATFDEFANLVKEVNSTQVSAGDFLSDNCYLYSRKTGKIEIAA